MGQIENKIDLDVNFIIIITALTLSGTSIPVRGKTARLHKQARKLHEAAYKKSILNTKHK